VALTEAQAVPVPLLQSPDQPLPEVVGVADLAITTLALEVRVVVVLAEVRAAAAAEPPAQSIRAEAEVEAVVLGSADLAAQALSLFAILAHNA
jgi:hypothetical protein